MTTQLHKLTIELESLKTQAALDTLRNPGQVTGENFGIAVGVQRGLELALRKVSELIKQEEGRV